MRNTILANVVEPNRYGSGTEITILGRKYKIIDTDYKNTNQMFHTVTFDRSLIDPNGKEHERTVGLNWLNWLIQYTGAVENIEAPV